MDAQDIHNLQEAYMEVVQNQQLDEGMTMKDFMTARKNRERSEKRKELSPTRRVGIHTPEKKPERDARRDAAYGETGHGGALRPKKVRKAKALGELGEQADLYDIILSHLLDEGYAETPEAAEAIMLNMGEDWRESILTESSHLEPDMKKRRKENEKAIEDMKNTKAYKDMVNTIRKKFDEEYVDEALRSREERMARMVTPKKRKEQERTRKGRAILADIQATERALNEPKTPKSNKPTYDTPAAEVRKLKPKQKTDTLAVRAGRVLRDT